MDTKAFLATFVAVFLAELGDKTQLATLGLAGGQSNRWAVFVAASLALTCTSAIAVLGADFISRWVSPLTLRRAAALLFVVMGVVTWWTSTES